MEAYLRVLIRQADRHCPPACKEEGVREQLVSVILSSVRSRRELEELLSNDEAVDMWCRQQRLSGPCSELLLLMQENKSAFTNIPWLDNLLTATFLAECLFIVWYMHSTGCLTYLCGALLLTAAIVAGTKTVSTFVGLAVGHTCWRLGAYRPAPAAADAAADSVAQKGGEAAVAVVAVAAAAGTGATATSTNPTVAKKQPPTATLTKRGRSKGGEPTSPLLTAAAPLSSSAAPAFAQPDASSLSKSFSNAAAQPKADVPLPPPPSSSSSNLGTDPFRGGSLTLSRWREQSWQLYVHLVMSFAEGYILSSETWLERPMTSLLPHPYELQMEDRLDMKAVYLAQLAVWIYTCLIHRFFDEHKKDYFVMYAHHVVTIALVAISYSAGYPSLGILVLYVHDVSDIFIDLLKLSNIAKLGNLQGFFLLEITWVGSMVAWAYWRLHHFPRIIYGTLLAPWILYCPMPRLWDGPLGLWVKELPLYVELNALLVILLSMHIYWFYLLLRVGLRLQEGNISGASAEYYSEEGVGGADDKDATAATTSISTSTSTTTSSSSSKKQTKLPPAALSKETEAEVAEKCTEVMTGAGAAPSSTDTAATRPAAAAGAARRRIAGDRR